MEYKDLQKMTVKKLREEAAKHEGITGLSGMKKDELVEALSAALGIEKPKKETKAKGAKKSKSEIKTEIKKLKEDRAKAIESKDAKQLKIARFHIKKLKRELGRISA